MNGFVKYAWVVLLSFTVGLLVGHGRQSPATSQPPPPIPSLVTVYERGNRVRHELVPHAAHVHGRLVVVGTPADADAPVWGVEVGDDFILYCTAR